MSTSPAPRLLSLDVYRGAVMFILASNALGLREVAPSRLTGPVLGTLAHHVRHSHWDGCTAWDLVQPAFLFMVGLAMPYSYAARAAQGDSHGTQLAHAFRRGAILVLLGLGLANIVAGRPALAFDNVLAQMGLGYPLAFWAMGLSSRGRLGFMTALLAGHWILFAGTGGWSPGTNVGEVLDRAWLPRGMVGAEDGYQTLSFLPAVANTLLGIMVADVLRSAVPPRDKLRTMVRYGAASLGVGILLALTVCPMIKRLWTPSFALWSGGFTVFFMAALYAWVDVVGAPSLPRFFRAMGMNSLAVYLLVELVRPRLVAGARHLWSGAWDGVWVPVLVSLGVAMVFWAFAEWLYRRRWFLRI